MTKTTHRDDLQGGQRSALPGLDSDDAQGSDDEETLLALQYLRSVRVEASGIPHVMTTNLPSQRTSQPWRGYYSDGAYIAAPVLGPTKPDQPTGLEYDDAKDKPVPVRNVTTVYHARLLQRYDAWKATLHNATAPTPHTTLSPSQWRQALLHGWPLTHTIQVQPQAVILAALATVTKTLLRPSLANAAPREQRRVGAWVWALLGILRESGTLDGEQVAVVRSLGKQAVVLGEECAGRRGAGRLNAAELEVRQAATVLDQLLSEENEEVVEVEKEEEGSEEGGQVEEAEVRRRNSSSSLSSLGIEEEDDDVEHAKEGAVVGQDRQCLVAALDMILTVVGERYGQRDLLSARATLWAV